MKLSTPTLPRKGHHENRPAPAPIAPPAAQAAALAPATTSVALKKAAVGLAAPTRQRNTAAMIVGVAFILIAAMIGASVASSFDDSIDVLVAADPIEEGQRLSADDFRVVRIAAAAGDIEVMAPDSIDDLVGRVAAGPIGEGSMIHPAQFTTGFDEQQILIGAALQPNHYPAGGLRSGDQVRLIALAGRGFDEDDGFQPGQEVAVGVITDVVPLSASGELHFSIRVPESSANVVVQLISVDRISLGLLDSSVDLDDVDALEPATPATPLTVPDAPEPAITDASEQGE